ncbi:MAG: TIGR04282 family arsenosugar biosynthesis glycosyltransferase [Candidatus Rokubacteria bacterium]|nr:TIGR04282 family arsenosugar biosynthesis glycosyltransferase [Candidatus Rokubacteria bacterium]MBI3824394.1 TIGR04282 family arsenosugar biosynthesis glycosyltransferase [Candidatus Rokubacteria bacterium]
MLPPAVAVMAKVPGLAPVKSRLCPALSAEQATALYRCFLLDRLDAVAGLSGVSGVVAYTPPEAGAAMRALAPPGLRLVPQQGKGLGERLASLTLGLLLDGHAGALAIDSDSPTLPMDNVLEAARLLARAEADVVLGPCDDGGYYLIGLRTPQPALFEDIPWSTSAVLGATLAAAGRRRLRTHLLPRWFDVDTEADLARLHAEMTARGTGPARTFAFVNALYEREPGEPGSPDRVSIS